MSQHDGSNIAAAAEGADLTGTLVAGRYRITRKLGEGGMGTVYQAVHEALRKPVALKMLSSRGSADKEIVARFEREAVAAANLRHPNIAEATDFGRLPDGAFYLVMEYVEGRTLRAMIESAPRGLPPASVLAILRQVAAALARAHAMDIVHRDLKPENIIVTGTAEAPGVKVIDFGIARVRSAMLGDSGAALTVAGAVFGTPEYMAPEQVMGKPAEAPADQYAFGVTAYEALTGRVPFTGLDVSQILMKHVNAPVPNAGEVAGHLSPQVSAVLSRLLAKRPEQRFPTIEEAFLALEAAFSAPVSSGGTVRMDGPVSRPGAAAPPALTGPVAPVATGALTGPAALAATAHIALPVPGQAKAQPIMTLPALEPVQAQPPPARTASAATLSTGILEPVKELLQDPQKKKMLVLVGAIGGGVLLLFAVVALIVWRVGAASLPGEISDALDDWQDGEYEKAEPVLKAELGKKPALASDAAVAAALMGAVNDDKGRGALSRLLNTTNLGRSAPLAAALADIGLQEPSAPRNGALKLLRGRGDLLPKEKRARVALRDADDCAALEKAVSELSGAGSDADNDAKRYRGGECNKLLRREELCGCPPPLPARRPGKKGR